MSANTPITITGRAAVLVSKYTGFDLSDPSKTAVYQFVYVRPDYVNKDGVLDACWTREGNYRHVGWAEIKVEVMPVDGMLKGAVAALENEKKALIADTQKRVTEIEGEIQKLLAIECAGVQS